MKIKRYELRSPAELIEEVARRVPLVKGKAYVVLVHDSSQAQRIDALDELACGVFVDDYAQARPLIEDWCRRHDPGVGIRPHTSIAVTVVVRPGLCVWTGVEWAWANAWRYAWTSGLSGGDLITVTEHGWFDFMTKHADHQPRMQPAR